MLINKNVLRINTSHKKHKWSMHAHIQQPSTVSYKMTLNYDLYFFLYNHFQKSQIQ